MMTRKKTPDELAYDAYNKTVGRYPVNGPWNLLGYYQKQAWENAALKWREEDEDGEERDDV